MPTTSSSPATTASATVTKPPNDNLSESFADIIPDELRDSPRFLDVVCWNIRWFHDRDPARVEQIAAVLGELNADIFVFEEILDNSLGKVAELLARQGAGHYEIAYGTTGGGQRIAFMWDLDWIRTKSDVIELFGKGRIVSADGKDAFPRLPLHAWFVGLVQGGSCFDFQMVGLHLKSQMGDGSPQRQRSAEALATWLRDESGKIDSDVIMLGDWNQKPSASVWKPLHELEAQGKALFTKINDDDDISHLMYRNASDLGSRLDMVLMSSSAAKQVKRWPSVARWKPLSALLSGTPQAKAIKKLLDDLRTKVSDHMPVVSRFYFKPTRKKAPALP